MEESKRIELEVQASIEYMKAVMNGTANFIGNPNSLGSRSEIAEDCAKFGHELVRGVMSANSIDAIVTEANYPVKLKKSEPLTEGCVTLVCILFSRYCTIKEAKKAILSEFEGCEFKEVRGEGDEAYKADVYYTGSSKWAYLYTV